MGGFKSEADQEKRIYETKKCIDRCGKYRRSETSFIMICLDLKQCSDNEGNMILTERLVLQEKKIWEEFLGKNTLPENNSCELYFEEKDIEGFVEKLERLYPSIQYVNRLMTLDWGQKMVQFYDPDGNLIEVENSDVIGNEILEC